MISSPSVSTAVGQVDLRRIGHDAAVARRIDRRVLVAVDVDRYVDLRFIASAVVDRDLDRRIDLVEVTAGIDVPGQLDRH
jgi:hypothetical protein